MQSFKSHYVDSSISLIANAMPHVPTDVEHCVELPILCDKSQNPAPGSVIKIAYRAQQNFLELFSLDTYVAAFYRHAEVRDMEYFVQAVAHDCAQALNSRVVCTGEMIYNGLSQRQTIKVVVDPQ